MEWNNWPISEFKWWQAFHEFFKDRFALELLVIALNVNLWSGMEHISYFAKGNSEVKKKRGGKMIIYIGSSVRRNVELNKNEM